MSETGRGLGRRARRGPAGAAAVCSLLGSLVAGCSLHGDVGWNARSPHQEAPVSLTVGGRMARPRGIAPYLGTHATFGDPTPGRTFSLRNAMLEVGGRIPVSRFTFELGAEAGLGEPAYVPLGGTGLYVGASAAMLVRLYGDKDRTPGFVPAALLLDLVATARGGVWTPPMSLGGSLDELGDGSLHLGLRVSLTSDLAVADSEEWERR